ncbi:hypothetical protein TWF730_002067 [Orbilia blumenaviensis]|uniref:F-box domain-containing protein n=1 Tax=Orbilia blumenaviensis TaxID=1796055 RepID=A0AAV9UGJ9_9PEZI
MASLISLVMVPELLYDILERLKRQDVFSLFLACRALYPVCYRHLWTTLELHQKAARPDLGFKDDVCIKLAKALDSLRSENFGLRFTKRLLLGFLALTVEGDFYQCKLLHLFSSLLAAGELDLVHVQLDIRLFLETGQDISEIYHFLDLLKEHSQKKQSGEFTLDIFAVPGEAVIKYLDTEKIVNLDLDVGIADKRNNRGGYTGRDFDVSQDNVPLAEALCQLFERTVHLKRLCLIGYAGQPLRHFKNFNFSKPIQDVRSAILNLEKVDCFIVKGKIFHPSFFLPPPPTPDGLSILVSYPTPG